MSATSSISQCALLISQLKEAKKFVDVLRVKIAKKQLVPTQAMATYLQSGAISVPKLVDSTNEIFFEPKVIPAMANVACTIAVARGEGQFVINSLTPNDIEIVSRISFTSEGGGAMHVIRLVGTSARLIATFSNRTGTEYFARLVTITQVP